MPKENKEEEDEIVKLENEKKQKEDQKLSQTYDYNNLKEGQYSLHLYIQETRNLVSPDKENQLDPLIKIEAFGQKKTTEVKKNRGLGMIYWGEHLFFETEIKTREELELQRLKITVQDYNLIGSNSLVGEVEVDILQIYFSENHAIEHRWVILSNPKKDFDQIQGFMKVSVQVYAQGDKQIVLKDEEKKVTSSLKDMGMGSKEDEEFQFGKIELLLPPQIKTIPHQLIITLIKGERFVKMDDYFGSIDPYVTFEFGSSKFKTKKKSDVQNPFWGERIYLPYSEPMVSNNLIIKLFDYETIGKDEIVGSTAFSKRDILQGLYKNYFWVNIYGSQTKSGKSSRQKSLMNSNPDLGSFWKGRILMGITSEQIEKPQKGVKQLSQKENEELSDPNYRGMTVWKIQSDVYYGLQFKEPDDKYEVMIRWADQEIVFPKTEATNGVWKWYRPQDKNIEFPYQNTNEMPDIFIYLIHDGKKVSFIRKPFKYFFSNILREPELMVFKPDLHMNPKLRNDQAGIIKIKIVINDPDVLNDAANRYRRANDIESPQKGFLVANIFNAQNLIPGDDSGKSDSFCQIEYYGKRGKTITIDDSLNPIYNRRVVLEDVDIFNMERQPPPLIIKFFDYDLIGDDFLGGASVDLNKMLRDGHLKINDISQPEPVWIDLKYGNMSSYQSCGRVLVSFNLLNQQYDRLKAKLGTRIDLQSEKYNVKIRILGLRDLKSMGLLPVKNAFVKFDINSLMTQEYKLSLKDQQVIQTLPKESGSNPNICTIITFDVNLPVETQYCPHMSVVVYDQIMKGWWQPILGTFSIDLAHYIIKTQKQYQFKIKKACDFLLQNTSKQRKSLSESLGFDVDQIIKQRQSKVQIPQDGQTLNLETENKNELNEKLIGQGGNDQSNLVSMNNDESKMVDHQSIQIEDSQLLDNEDVEMSEMSEIIPDPQEQIRQTGEVGNSDSLVRFAKYSYKKKMKAIMEDGIPDAKKYMALSWDPKATRLGNKVSKHYRYYVNSSLEESVFIDLNTFDQFNIQRGTRLVKESWFSDEVQHETTKNVGVFKGWIEIISEKQKNIFKKNLMGKLLPGMVRDLDVSNNNNTGGRRSLKKAKSKSKLSVNGVDSIEQTLVKRDQLDNEFMVKQSIVVRVYILGAYGLTSCDSDSLSDPYVKVKLGNQEVDDSKNYQQDMANCDIYKMYELKGVLPGASQLHVQLWDKDSFVFDDLIGETIIDLENRFFSKRWRNLSYKPIESRQLYLPTSKLSRGMVKMFLEIIPSSEPKLLKEIWQIAPKPKQKYELRVVIWEVNDCPAMDIEDTSDLFVTGQVGEDRQQTDTHWRSQNGSGSFNWRMVFDVELPMADPSITISIWDKDILSPSDFISTGTLDFSDLANKAFSNDCSIKLMGNMSKTSKITEGAMNAMKDAFNKDNNKNAQTNKDAGRDVQKYSLALKNQEKSGYFATKDEGKLTMTMELVPTTQAKSNPVGKGRSDPNHSPWCPPPIGRFEWSWNPITLFFRLVGPKARTKICILICTSICFSILVTLLPVVFGDLIVKWIT